MAADVVGYSRLMGIDEEGTLAALKSVRAAQFDSNIVSHHGRIVKTTGDGLLVEFPSVVDAVRCAVAVQQAIAQHNQALPNDKRIEFRIGINLGDVLVDQDDIFGDGVNIAARLEPIAPPGGICISASVYDQVRGHVDVEFRDIGDKTLKNINRTVRAYFVRAPGIAFAGSTGELTKSQSKKSRNLYLRMQESLVFFDERFTEVFPGKRMPFEVADPSLASSYLLRLLRSPLSATDENFTVNPIWWWRGYNNMHIQKVERLRDGALLMDYYEIDIRRIVAFPEPSYKYRFVYVEANAEKPTGVYPISDDDIKEGVTDSGYFREEYCIYKNDLYSREEYDDNGAERGGRLIKFNGRAKLRVRNLSPYDFLISGNKSPINNQSADEKLGLMLDEILQGTREVITLRDFVRRLPAKS